MKRILVALDGSAPAGRALELAVSIAQKFDAVVTTINVSPALYVPPEPYAITDGELEEALRRVRRAMRP